MTLSPQGIMEPSKSVASSKCFQALLDVVHGIGYVLFSIIICILLIVTSPLFLIGREIARILLILRHRRWPISMPATDAWIFCSTHSPNDSENYYYVALHTAAEYQVVLDALTSQMERIPKRLLAQSVRSLRYPFWIPAKQCRPEDRVLMYLGSVEECITRNIGSQTGTGQSWTLFACRNGIAFHVQHGLLDGISSMRFLTAILCKNPEKVQLGPAPKRSPGVADLLCGALHFWRYFSYILNRDFNDFFDAPISRASSMTWSPPISLKLLKYIGKKHRGATVNDILLACAFRVFERHELYRHPKRKNFPKITAMCPVSTHKASELDSCALDDNLRNNVSSMMLTLPCKTESTAHALRLIMNISSKMKQGSSIYTLGQTTKLSFNHVPVPYMKRFVTFAGSSVPGPIDRLLIAGKFPVDRLFVTGLLLCTGPAMCMEYTRYADELTVNITADPKALEVYNMNVEEFLYQFLSELRILETGIDS